MAYFDGRRAMLDGFVSLHFTWPGAHRLHGTALGWFILQSPLNVALSPIVLTASVVPIGWRDDGSFCAPASRGGSRSSS